MSLKISTTYETWNESSIDAGETDDRGYEIFCEDYTFSQLVDLIRGDGYTEDSGNWYSTCDAEIDYRTGESTYRHLHFVDVPRKRKYFELAWRIATRNRRNFRLTSI